jgi:hypothetical protein
MNSLSDLSPVIIPVIALLIPIVGIVAAVTLKITRLHLLHETVRHLSSVGQPIPPAVLDEIIGRKSF